jgi:transcriptional regulator with XRE-family HTH domain
LCLNNTHKSSLSTTSPYFLISLLERGLRQPSLKTILQLAKPLGIKPSELVAQVAQLTGDESK